MSTSSRRTPQRLIAIGASAGGVTALRALVAGLPHDLPACVLITLHIGSRSSSLPQLLDRSGKLPARHAHDGDLLRHGEILVAPPDRHLLIEGPAVRVWNGPKEHHTRPAIDPMFLSAALELRRRVIGVVLTGGMDDGTAGLRAIRQCGGVGVVQDPAEAEDPSMPASALRHAGAEHCVGIDAMAALLVRLVEAPLPAEEVAEPGGLSHELDLTLLKGEPMAHLQSIGEPSPFVCPDCGGGLWTLAGQTPPRYRCHTGHGYSLTSLLDAQGKSADDALWSALRTLQEREALLRRSAAWKRQEHETDEAARFEAIARELAEQTERLAGLLNRLSAVAP